MGTVVTTPAEVTIGANEEVTLVLVPTSTAGLPRDASADVAWKGSGAYNQPVAQLTTVDSKTVIAAPGVYVVTKGAGSYNVERS